MEPNDIRTLKILEELDNDHAPSQRDLAQSLGVSLGLVNSFLKRLVNKGYFKVTTIPKNRVRYILTPKGMAEKTRLTYKYIERSYRFYREARQRLRDLFEDFEAQGVNSVVFYGVTDLAEIAYISLHQTDIEFVGIVDEVMAGNAFMGKIIEDPDGLSEIEFDKLLITSIELRNLIREKICEMGIDLRKIALPE